MKINALALAFIRAIKAELRLQNELAKKYPFGSNDLNEIAELASGYRSIHAVSKYYEAFIKGYDPDKYCVYGMPECQKRHYIGSYGVFGDTMGNIVCKHGCDMVIAHNPDEAMDILQSREDHCSWYNDWLLTSLALVNNPREYDDFDYLTDRHHDIVALVENA